MSVPQEYKDNLREILATALVTFGINKSQLASRIKVSQSTIGQWLSNDSNQFPNEDNRKAIAFALGMTYERLEAEIKGTPFNPNPAIGVDQVADYLNHCNLRDFFLLLQDTISPRWLKETRLSLVGEPKP